LKASLGKIGLIEMLGAWHQKLRFFSDNDLFKHTSIMLIATIVAGACNYKKNVLPRNCDVFVFYFY